MNNSILTTVKKMLGIDEEYTAFDLDIIIHINSVFSTLYQLGLGPTTGFSIEDKSTTWEDFLDGNTLQHLIKSYMVLRVRLLFDPPATSFAIESFAKQIQEFEWRINMQREQTDYVPLVIVLDDVDGVIGGGTP